MSMSIEGTDCFYYNTEREFVKYFDRLQAIGVSYDEIESKLPQLEKYYFEMVVKGVFYINIPTLQDLFNDWKEN